MFFLGDRLSGLIDFYFACNDLLAYDLAICLNAWCFETDAASTSPRRARCSRPMSAVRPLRAAELAALPLLARGAALRFLLTRLRLAQHRRRRPGEAEGPDGISAQAALPSRREVLSRLRAWGALSDEREAQGRDLHRRRLQGQSRARRLGRDPDLGIDRKELKGGEAQTTNNRMELMAAIRRSRR